MNNKWEELTISNDFIFSKVMRDKEICKEMLELLLDVKIVDVKYIEEQKSIDIAYDSKSVRLDVYVASDDKLYNIEMQVANNKDLSKRTRYYQGMIDLDIIEKGELYKNLKDTFIIFICTFDPFNEDRPKYTFENLCLENKNLKLNDGSMKIFFNTKAYNKETNVKLQHFLNFVNGQHSNDDFTEKLLAKIENIKLNKEWRIEYMTLLMREQEIAEENFLKGIGRGKHEEKIDIAKNLLDVLNDETISQKTGLSIDIISDLRINANN